MPIGFVSFLDGYTLMSLSFPQYEWQSGVMWSRFSTSVDNVWGGTDLRHREGLGQLSAQPGERIMTNSYCGPSREYFNRELDFESSRI